MQLFSHISENKDINISTNFPFLRTFTIKNFLNLLINSNIRDKTAVRTYAILLITCQLRGTYYIIYKY